MGIRWATAGQATQFAWRGSIGRQTDRVLGRPAPVARWMRGFPDVSREAAGLNRPPTLARPSAPAPSSTDRRCRRAIARFRRSVCGRGLFPASPGDVARMLAHNVVEVLSVVDPEGGAQPFVSEDGRTVLVLNGEIYNHDELRNELAQRGYPFRTRSDTEVLLRLYEEMGIACIGRLRGMFSFALYDHRERRLWVARDRIGVKPLYYVQHAEEDDSVGIIW